MRDHRSGRGFVPTMDPDGHLVAGKNLDGSEQGGFAESVRVSAHDQRPVDAFHLAVFVDGLADSRHMVIGKGAVQGGAAVSAGTKSDGLQFVLRVGMLVVVGGPQ